MTRQFQAGDRFTINRVPFRVERGRKKPGDLLLEVWAPPGQWEAVEMRMVGMCHAFFCENEDHLYPPSDVILGADYWRAFLRLCEDDWQAASKNLARDKAWADRKRRGAA